jgi:hypothetical protein
LDGRRRINVAVRIPGKSLDKRVEQILRNPKAYFETARRNARAEVKAEQEQSRVRLRNRTA